MSLKLELLENFDLVERNLDFYNAEDRPILKFLSSDHTRQECYEGDKDCGRQINLSFVPCKTLEK